MTNKLMLLTSFMAILPLAMAQTQTSAPTQAGLVQGNVIASDTNAPLDHAAIELRPLLAAGRAGQIIRRDTDQKGEFVLARVAPGPYMLTVKRAGYQEASYTTGTAAFRGTRFTLNAGESKTVRLRLTPLGVVGGIVSSQDGAPLEHARVMLSRYRTVDGVRVLVPEREVWTDQTGSFRAAGIPSGQYLLSASSRNEGRLDNVAKIYPPSYFPGAASPTGAQYIKVEAGRTAGDLKLQLGAARGLAISGQVNDLNGAPLAGTTVLARRQSEDGTPNLLSSESLTVKTGASAQFLLNRLRPGKYRLMVTGGPNAQKLTGATLVDLGNEDAQNVALAAGPGAVVTGKIAFEGNFEGLKGPVNPRVARLALRSEVDAGGPGLVRGVVADDSTFRMENVPEGPARLSISLVTDAFYVKSITLNGQDVTNQPLNVVKNGQLDGVQMVISLVDAQLSGRVAPDANPQPGAPSPAVVLFPDTQASIQGPARVAHVNGSGQFTIRGIAPGNYRIVAVRNLAEGSESDPGFLTAVQGQAGQIAVAARKANAGIMQAIDAPR